MLALRLAGGLLLVVCGALGGLYLAERARGRLAFLEAYEAFLLTAASLVSSCGADLSVILGYAEKNAYLRELAASAQNAVMQGTDPRPAWKSAAEEASKHGRIRSEDVELVSSFADYDGEEDTDSRTGRLNFLLDRTRQRLSVLKKETEEKRRLYRILGTFIGALAAAVLI